MNKLHTTLLELYLLCPKATNCNYTDIAVTFVLDTENSYQNGTLDSNLFMVCLRMSAVAQNIRHGMQECLVNNKLKKIRKEKLQA
jgi:hypothetical protein